MYVLDSYALFVYFQGEPGKERVREIFHEVSDAQQPALMTLINLSEVLYGYERRHGPDAAKHVLGVIDQLPIQLLPADRDTAIAAAQVKASYPMSLADAFAAAVALRNRFPLVTGDAEFKPVEPLVKIDWLPSS